MSEFKIGDKVSLNKMGDEYLNLEGIIVGESFGYYNIEFKEYSAMGTFEGNIVLSPKYFSLIKDPREERLKELLGL